MATNDFLSAEARERPRVAIVAIVAAVLTIAAPVMVLVAISGTTADNAFSSAFLTAEHRTVLLASTAVSALGLLALTYVLDFLLRATMHRSPQTRAFIRPLLIVGGIAMAIVTVVLRVLTAVRIDHFVNESTLTWQELKDASSYGALAFVALAAQFAFAFAFIFVALNAMRVGLLTRFLGYLGVFSAVLFVIPILPLPIVQVYWLAMLALLLWGFNKAREPPAWSSDREVLWPTAAEMREQRVRAAEARKSGAVAEPQAVDAVVAADDDVLPGSGDDSSAARRKRKKRR